MFRGSRTCIAFGSMYAADFGLLIKALYGCVHSTYLHTFTFSRTKIDVQKYFKIPFTWKNCVALSVKRRQHSGILKILKNPFMVLQKNISNYAKINNLHVQV